MPFEIASSFKKLCIKLFHMLDAFQLSSFIFFPFYFKNLCLQRNQSWTKPLRKDANYHGPWKQQEVLLSCVKLFHILDTF